MNLLETILESRGGALGQITKQLGLSESQARSAVGALTPALSRGIENNVAQPGGLESLLQALSSGNHQRYVDEPETLGSEESIADGNAILGHILGSKDSSRSVAGQAAQETGVDASILKKMLPLLAATVMGSLSKQTAGGQIGQGAEGGALQALSGFLGGDSQGQAGGLLNLAKKLFK